MTAFLDTSALLGLYLDEPGSSGIRGFVEIADRRCVCSIAWLEAHGALARRIVERRTSEAQARRVLEYLAGDADAFTRIHVDDTLARLAGALADRHGLDGVAALQIAAALVEQRRGHAVRFLTLDERLMAAASDYFETSGEPRERPSPETHTATSASDPLTASFVRSFGGAVGEFRGL